MPHPLHHAALLLTLAGCAHPDATPHQDRVHYQAGVSEGAPGDRLAHCRAIQEQALQGDCYAALAQDGEDIEGGDLCGELPASLWRDECFFTAAERARATQDHDRAATLCMEAGRFLNDCSIHLWRGELRTALHPGGMRTLFEDRRSIDRIHDRWATLFADRARFDATFWEHCYQIAFERADFLPAGACDAMPATEQEACLAAAAQTYRRWLQQALDDPSHKRLLCDQPTGDLRPSAVGPALGLPGVPDGPAMVAVLQAFRDARCAGGD